jgi:hypothetical protein
MDEIKLGQAQHRGIRAAELLENTLLQEAFQFLETAYLNAWRSTKALDTQSREKLWQAIQILGIIQEHLKVHIRDGKIAAEDLRRLSEESNRRKP